MYVLAKSEKRIHKERAMRRRKLKNLWQRLHALQGQKLTRDQLLMKLGAAKKEAGRACFLVEIRLPEDEEDLKTNGFDFSLRKNKLRQVRRREGRYLLRSNLTQTDPAQLWQYYIQLTEIEQAFKELKGDLSIRPIYHQRDERIEAHIFVAFVAYCLQATLKQRARALAPGLTSRAVLEKFAAMQNGRRASTHHRRTSSDSASLHTTGKRSAAVAHTTQAGTAATAAAEDSVEHRFEEMTGRL